MRHKPRRITGTGGSGLNAHMDDATIPLQRLRTIRRCQRKIGALMDELNEVAKQIATIRMRFQVGSREDLELREACATISVIMLEGDRVTGWLDNWILARQAQQLAQEQAHHDDA